MGLPLGKSVEKRYLVLWFHVRKCRFISGLRVDQNEATVCERLPREEKRGGAALSRHRLRVGPKCPELEGYFERELELTG